MSLSLASDSADSEEPAWDSLSLPLPASLFLFLKIDKFRGEKTPPKHQVLGHLAGLVGRACNSLTWGCVFEPHVVGRVKTNKQTNKQTNKPTTSSCSSFIFSAKNLLHQLIYIYFIIYLLVSVWNSAWACSRQSVTVE